ncbi:MULTISPECIES: hypothetical protein [Niastella]|uniref:Lipoprotein n=1 Tax=Niastella soli TaxID=2821487 RepID=A0ABS3Z5C2_9BACT|nr:hypothetical protein [Niastella soli]MBO9205365.1 hypothetical protein [Niastella soli]
MRYFSLIAGTIFFATIGCKSESNSNTILLKSYATAPAKPSAFFNSIEQASFKYTRSDLFKTGKLPAAQLIFTADSTIHSGGTKYLTKLKYYNTRKGIFGMGSLVTSNTTMLLFTKDKQFHTLEVKGAAGYFEFLGNKNDKYYFRLSMPDAVTTCFSLSLDQPDVLITEYTVEGE